MLARSRAICSVAAVRARFSPSRESAAAASSRSRASHSARFCRSISRAMVCRPRSSPAAHCRLPYQRRPRATAVTMAAQSVTLRPMGVPNIESSQAIMTTPTGSWRGPT